MLYLRSHVSLLLQSVVVLVVGCSSVPFEAVVDGREVDIDRIDVYDLQRQDGVGFSVWGRRDGKAGWSDTDTAYVVDVLLATENAGSEGTIDLAGTWTQPTPGMPGEFVAAAQSSPVRELRAYYYCFGCDKPTRQQHSGQLSLMPDGDGLQGRLHLVTHDGTGDWYYFDKIEISTTFFVSRE